jgi:hypothetical protein
MTKRRLVVPPEVSTSPSFPSLCNHQKWNTLALATAMDRCIQFARFKASPMPGSSPERVAISVIHNSFPAVTALL